MGIVFNKALPRARWLDPEQEREDRAYLRACWQAQPVWADVAAMRAVYARARRRRMVVDHIVPLRHPHVCGLHTPANMRIVTPTENMHKGNRHWPDMFHEQLPLFSTQLSPHQLTLTGVMLWDTAQMD